MCFSVSLRQSLQNVSLWVWLWVCGSVGVSIGAWMQTLFDGKWAGRVSSVPRATKEEEEEEVEEEEEEEGEGRTFEMGSW